MKRVSSCGMCMMGRFFVVSSLMMLSCFAVVTRGMRMMLCRLLMVLGCFFGHIVFPLFGGPVLVLRATTELPNQRNCSFMTSALKGPQRYFFARASRQAKRQAKRSGAKIARPGLGGP